MTRRRAAAKAAARRWAEAPVSDGWRPPAMPAAVEALPHSTDAAAQDPADGDQEKEEKAKKRVKDLLALLEKIEIWMGQVQHLLCVDDVAMGMRALGAIEEESSTAWEEVIRAIAERLARRQATSLDPAPSRSAASSSLDPDQDQEKAAKGLVEMVQREVANLEIQIEELDEEKLFLSCALAAKEKESEQAWEEVIMAVAERLARSEATSLDPAPSPISSVIECHTSRARSARAKPSTAARRRINPRSGPTRKDDPSFCAVFCC